MVMTEQHKCHLKSPGSSQNVAQVRPLLTGFSVLFIYVSVSNFFQSLLTNLQQYCLHNRETDSLFAQVVHHISYEQH